MQTEFKLVTITESNEMNTPFKSYGGIFKIEKRIVMFNGHTVPLEGIAQVISYPVRPKPIISIGNVFFFGIVLFIIYSLASSGMPLLSNGESYRSSEPNGLAILGMLVCIFFIGYGIWERVRPVLYGFTIELISGSYYPFVHKDKLFIDNLYQGFTEAIREKRDFEANFKNLTINSGKFAGSTNPIDIAQGATTGAVTGGTATLPATATTTNSGQFAGANNPTVVGNDNVGAVTGGSVNINNGR